MKKLRAIAKLIISHILIFLYIYFLNLRTRNNISSLQMKLNIKARNKPEYFSTLLALTN